jgi:predicted amidophosphoribosyltransferase
MSNYIGVRCPVCNKKFTEADDIVVCPVCGAPHHRSCYAEKNQCAFVEDHLSGKEWHDPAGQVPPSEQEAANLKTCARCGEQNKSDNLFCQTCGYPITAPNNQSSQGETLGDGPYHWFGMGELGGTQVNAISMAYGGLKPDDEIDGETVK